VSENETTRGLLTQCQRLKEYLENRPADRQRAIVQWPFCQWFPANFQGTDAPTAHGRHALFQRDSLSFAKAIWRWRPDLHYLKLITYLASGPDKQAQQALTDYTWEDCLDDVRVAENSLRRSGQKPESKSNSIRAPGDLASSLLQARQRAGQKQCEAAEEINVDEKTYGLVERGQTKNPQDRKKYNSYINKHLQG
jgi:DNA-binding XRE family transcriptional regulator